MEHLNDAFYIFQLYMLDIPFYHFNALDSSHNSLRKVITYEVDFMPK